MPTPYSPTNTAYMSEYGPIHGAFGPSAESKFRSGFGQQQAIPGINPAVQQGGSQGSGSSWNPNGGASYYAGLGGGIGEVPPWAGDNISNIQQITNNFTGSGDGQGVIDVGYDGSSNSLIASTSGEDLVTDSMTTVRFRGIQSSDGTISITSAGGGNDWDLKATSTAAFVDSDTIDVNSANTRLDGKYEYSTNSEDFFRATTNGTNEVVFTAGDHAVTKFMFGVGSIVASAVNPGASTKPHQFSYTFTRIAGDIDASGTCHNLVETNNEQSGTHLVAGVDINADGYPSTYSPAPATTTHGASGTNQDRFCCVFIWKDVNNQMGKGAGAHFFQLQNGHDGACPSSNG